MRTGGFYQEIPRPDVVLPGERPPWSEFAEAERSSVTVEQVRAAFDGQSLDGAEADADGASAAILVAIGDVDGEAVVVLTRRALTLDRDPGLIAFPGGYIERDERALEAALREADEEIGLHPTDVEVVGSLGAAVRHRNRFKVATFVGIVRGRPEYFPSEDEVDSVFEVPLHRLLADGVGWKEEWQAGEESRTICFFSEAELLGHNLVWGLTARVLWDLLVAVSAA